MKTQLKNSETDWIGLVPFHWKKDKLFRLCDKMGSGGTPHSTNEGFYNGDIPWIQSGDLTDSYVSETEKKITKEALDNSSAKIFPKGTLLVAMYGATIGKLGIMEMDAATNQACCALQLSKKLHSKFAYYLMNDVRDYLITQAYGGGQPNISQVILKQLHLFFPPLPEQKAIANYLDKACQRIDKIIEIKQKQLEKIEEHLITKITDWVTKGVNNTIVDSTNCLWIPNINQGWKITPLKRMLAQKLKYGANESAENENVDEPRYIRITDFGDDGNLKDDTFKSLPSDIAKPYMLNEGDVLFARSGATVGKTFIFKNYLGEACFAGYLIKANCDRTKLLPEYLYYFTKSKAYQEWKNLIFTQATIQNIGADKYQYLLLPQPNLSEQKEIVNLIENLWNKTGKLKSNIKSQITTLKSYRKSLIHECVTGKKQVWEKELENMN